MSIADDDQDLTRRQRREEARAKRKQIEEAQAAGVRRRTRLTQLAVAGTIAILAILVVLIVSGGGKNGGLRTTPSEASAVVGEVSSLIGGIPQNGNALGSPSAPVTLQYFGDLECPVCKQFTEGALKPLIERDVRGGKLRVEYRSLQTATPEAATFKTQQVAALAAGEQQKAWYYIELFYHQQGEEKTGYVTESYLQGLAKQVPGLDVSKWSADRSNPQLGNSVATDQQAANSYGFTGTPSFALGKTAAAAKKFEPASYTDPSSFETAVQALAGH